MPAAKRPMKRKLQDEKSDKKENLFEFSQDQKELSGSEDDVEHVESDIMDKMAKKRPLTDFEEEDGACPVGNEVLTMMEKFGADISKVMQTKKKRLETLTKNYMKGSQQKLEQLWNNYHSQRKKMTEQYSQEVTLALQQWETEAQRTEEQGERLSNLFRQQQKVFQQSRVAQNQKLKTVRELYEQFMKNVQDMDKSHDVFLKGAQQELKKEMATLQKKILMDTQQQEMATVRKSLQSMLF